MPTMLAPRKTATASEMTREFSFRNLYTRVLLGLPVPQVPKGPKAPKAQHPVLGVTSAIAGEGKTTIASGLAAALAEDKALLGFGREPGTTLLVQCNDAAPPEDPRLAVPPGSVGPGLIGVLGGECTLEAAIRTTGVEGLDILPVGEPAHAPEGTPSPGAGSPYFPLAIRTPALPDVIAQLRSRYGLVILDLPPVLNSTDTQVLARLADQLILVVRAGVTPAKLVQQALDQLDEAMLLGVVLNDSRPELPPWLEHRL